MHVEGHLSRTRLVKMLLAACLMCFGWLVSRGIRGRHRGKIVNIINNLIIQSEDRSYSDVTVGLAKPATAAQE
jgi:hypothetical protein